MKAEDEVGREGREAGRGDRQGRRGGDWGGDTMREVVGVGTMDGDEGAEGFKKIVEERKGIG